MSKTSEVFWESSDPEIIKEDFRSLWLDVRLA